MTSVGICICVCACIPKIYSVQKVQNFVGVWCLELGNGTTELLSFVFCTGYQSVPELSTNCLWCVLISLQTPALDISLIFFSPTSQPDYSALRLMTIRSPSLSPEQIWPPHFYCGEKQWNSLPFHVRHLPTTESFKHALKDLCSTLITLVSFITCLHSFFFFHPSYSVHVCDLS